MKVITITRGSVLIGIENKEIYVGGEALMPPKGSNEPDFVVYSNDIHFSGSNQALQITDDLKAEIIEFIRKHFVEKGMLLEVV